MKRSTKWLLVYVMIGLALVIIDIVAPECDGRKQRPATAPTTRSTAAGDGLR